MENKESCKGDCELRYIHGYEMKGIIKRIDGVEKSIKEFGDRCKEQTHQIDNLCSNRFDRYSHKCWEKSDFTDKRFRELDKKIQAYDTLIEARLSSFIRRVIGLGIGYGVIIFLYRYWIKG